jgi:hypothetical protein
MSVGMDLMGRHKPAADVSGGNDEGKAIMIIIHAVESVAGWPTVFFVVGKSGLPENHLKMNSLLFSLTPQKQLGPNN